ncbi:hypothetical protein C8R43DRAFT_1134651 [Mycena crocata]|nr:hypothetical protein C8R43DRAFT_1134651 [Mycena crocata]
MFLRERHDRHDGSSCLTDLPFVRVSFSPPSTIGEGGCIAEAYVGLGILRGRPRLGRIGVAFKSTESPAVSLSPPSPLDAGEIVIESGSLQLLVQTSRSTPGRCPSGGTINAGSEDEASGTARRSSTAVIAASIGFNTDWLVLPQLLWVCLGGISPVTTAVNSSPGVADRPRYIVQQGDAVVPTPVLHLVRILLFHSSLFFVFCGSSGKKSVEKIADAWAVGG